MKYLKYDTPLLVIIGPSGSGKSSTIRLLNDQRIIEVTPSWTTRSPRPYELQKGIEHHFVSDQVFQLKENDDYFLESVSMFGLPFKYGLPKIQQSLLGAVPVVMLRVSLIPLFSKHYTNFIIYQIEDSFGRVSSRLKERVLAGEEIGSRLSDYRKEVKEGRVIADRIFINKSSIKSLVLDIKQALVQDFKK